MSTDLILSVGGVLCTIKSTNNDIWSTINVRPFNNVSLRSTSSFVIFFIINGSYDIPPPVNINLSTSAQWHVDLNGSILKRVLPVLDAGSNRPQQKGQRQGLHLQMLILLALKDYPHHLKGCHNVVHNHPRKMFLYVTQKKIQWIWYPLLFLTFIFVLFLHIRISGYGTLIMGLIVILSV